MRGKTQAIGRKESNPLDSKEDKWIICIRMGKKNVAIICDGNIDTEKIYNIHRQIKEIVEAYKQVNVDVAKITKRVKENWVGEGRNEFESQYNLLISKIEDFGDTLYDIYDALVEAEMEYETSDDSLRQEFVKAKQY